MSKRLTVSLLLVAILLLTLPVNAADTSGVCYIKGKTGSYSTVKEAVDAAESGDTVIITADSTETGAISIGSKSITIKSEGSTKHTIDSTSLSSIRYQFESTDSGAGLNIENVDLKHKNGFWFYPITLSLTNCTVNTEGGIGLNYCYKKSTSNSTRYNITLTACQWTVNTGGTFALIGNGNSDVFGDLIIDNTDIELQSGSDGTAIKCDTTGQMDINILNASSIKLSGTDTASFFDLCRDNDCHITLGQASELVLAQDSGEASVITGAVPKTLTDKGAIFKNEGERSLTLNMPMVSKEGSTLLGWCTGTELYSPTAALTLQSGATASSLFLEQNSFYAEDGASLRTVKGELGIRFTTLISNELLTRLGDNVKFVTYVVPLSGSEGDPLGETAKDKLIFDHQNYNSEYAEGMTAVHAAIIMNPADVDEKSIYSLSLSARTVMNIRYADGTAAAFTTAFEPESNTRSMAQVAYNLENHHNISNEVTRHILSICPYVSE